MCSDSGQNKNFDVEVTIQCQPQVPYLSTATVAVVNTDDFVLTESIGAIKFKVDDLTSAVQNTAKSLLTHLFEAHAFIPFDGKTLTVVGLFETVAEAQTKGAAVLCA